jgi:cytochrome c oxidase subunit 1
MSSVGAFVIALSILIFMINFIMSVRKGEASGEDPWDARTLEWAIPSPPPHYNFAEIPRVHSLDEFWHQKYTEDSEGRPIPVVAGAAEVATEEHGSGGHDIHMPSPSFMPLIAALGFPLIALGLIYDYAILAAGATVLIVGIYGWAFEPATEDAGEH